MLNANKPIELKNRTERHSGRELKKKESSPVLINLRGMTSNKSMLVKNTVLNSRSSSGKTTLCETLMCRLNCSMYLNLLRCKARMVGRLFTRIRLCASWYVEHWSHLNLLSEKWRSYFVKAVNRITKLPDCISDKIVRAWRYGLTGVVLYLSIEFLCCWSFSGMM